MAKDEILFPHILKKPAGERMKVEDQEEYDRAAADGWSLDVPEEPPAEKRKTTTTETVTEADPNPPQPPPKPLTPAPPAKDEEGAETSTARHAPKTDGAHDLVLDGTVADVVKHVERVDDIRQLQELRRQESKGANRVGVQEAIKARIEEIKG